MAHSKAIKIEPAKNQYNYTQRSLTVLKMWISIPPPIFVKSQPPDAGPRSVVVNQRWFVFFQFYTYLHPYSRRG